MFTAADRPGAAKGAHASGTSPCGCFQKQARGLEQYSRELRQASWNWRSLQEISEHPIKKWLAHS